jgi:acetoin utilization protein AcuB
MRVSELMTRHVATIELSDSAHTAVGRMVARKIRHLPVVSADGALVGVVTDRDLRHHLFSAGILRGAQPVSVDALLKAARVNEVMSAPATTVDPDDDVDVAARRMLEHKIGSLPVVRNGHVVGMITETDLLRRIAATEACSPECAAIVVSVP